MPKRSPKPVPALPLLTVAELEMLRDAPYDLPRRVRGLRREETARVLVEAGLLERDPSTKLTIVRCTAEGMLVSAPLSKAAALRQVQAILDECGDDPESAASHERALWQRVLVESALGYVRTGVPEIALRTLRYDFRRG